MRIAGTWQGIGAWESRLTMVIGTSSSTPRLAAPCTATRSKRAEKKSDEGGCIVRGVGGRKRNTTILFASSQRIDCTTNMHVPFHPCRVLNLLDKSLSPSTRPFIDHFILGDYTTLERRSNSDCLLVTRIRCDMSLARQVGSEQQTAFASVQPQLPRRVLRQSDVRESS
jgi:hypothetical protein